MCKNRLLVFEIARETAREATTFGWSGNKSGFLTDVENAVSQVDPRQVEIKHNLSVCQQGDFEDLGCSKQLLSLMHGLAMRFVTGPVFFLTVAATVDDPHIVAGLVLRRVRAAGTLHRRSGPTFCTFCQIC